MNKVEEIDHIRTLFRQSEFDEIMLIVKSMRDKAINYLNPIKANVPRAISDHAIKKYQDLGISLEWDLTDCDSVYEFSVMSRSIDMSQLQISAVELLRASTDVIRAGTLTETGKDWLLSTYAMLDSPAIEKAEKFKPGRLQGSQSETTKYIYNLVKQYPNESAKVLFHRLADKSVIGKMALKTFSNHVTEAKKVQKNNYIYPQHN